MAYMDEYAAAIRIYQAMHQSSAAQRFQHSRAPDVNAAASVRRNASSSCELRATAVVYCENQALPPSKQGAVRFVAISDTHTQHGVLDLPKGDVLVHCGDFSNIGSLEECTDFCDFMAVQPFERKLLVPGNHDLTCDAEWYSRSWEEWHTAFQSPEDVSRMLQNAGVEVLNSCMVSVRGISVFGSPMQPRQPQSRTQMAFGRTRGAQLKSEWQKLPSEGLDVLLTHTPPAGILDGPDTSGKPVGCEELKKAVLKVKPIVHVFGHIHRGYGIQSTRHTHFINASSAVERRGEGGQLNPPVVFDVCRGGVASDV